MHLHTCPADLIGLFLSLRTHLASFKIFHHFVVDLLLCRVMKHLTTLLQALAPLGIGVATGEQVRV